MRDSYGKNIVPRYVEDNFMQIIHAPRMPVSDVMNDFFRVGIDFVFGIIAEDERGARGSSGSRRIHSLG